MDDDARAELVAAIGTHERELHTLLMRWVGPTPLPSDLTLRQLQVLTLLRATPDVTGHDLAASLEVSTATVSGLVDRLVGKALVAREQDHTDRRRVLLRLSPEGERTLIDLEMVGQQAKESVLARLGEEDLRLLVDVYGRVLQAARSLSPGER